ncbi:TlpA family protein disulfide reductase [Algoriphagus litoralis]|uniref:TlpA family protein disulfide reductase n=1 Tax=Algoriphagus litoralis TaxID=2202829 RepID=UPI00130081E1|nr:hypothetical protein [Algoriphagus litoralis]
MNTLLLILLLSSSIEIPSSKVADSPPEVQDHRPAPSVSPHSGDAHRGGAILSDVFQSSVSEGMIYFEIASPIPPDTLWITYWEHLLSDAPSVTPGTRIPLIAEKGTYFEGSAGTQVFSFVFPEELESGFISIAAGKSTLADQWSIHAGDRVRIRFDLTSGNALFGGPKAAFFRTQYLLDQAFKEEKFNSNPILIANRSEGLFADDASGAAYRKAKSKAQDIHVSMQVLVPKENGWDYLQDYLNKPLDQHPAFFILENTAPDLTDWERDKLNSRVKGQILSTATKRAERIADQLVADQEKGKALLDWSKKLQLGQVKSAHPLLVQGLSSFEILKSKINSESLLANLTQYPEPLKDELLGYFLLSNYNRLQENLDAYLLTGIEQVNTSWIKSKLEYLHQVQLGPFLSEGLYDEEGRKVDFSQFEGKTLLLHFWISGCKFCKDDYEMALQPLQELLESNEDILLVTVNADGGEGSWMTSLATGNYTSPEMLNLRAEKGTGVLDRYKIHSFPQKMIIGPDSKIRLQTLDKMGPMQLQLLLNKTQSNSALTISSTQPH